jgi:hypothetical protein
VKTFVIRCGTPDCDLGKKMCDLGEEQLRLCYSEFRKHCIQRHDLQEWDTTRTCTWTWKTGCRLLSRHSGLSFCTLTAPPPTYAFKLIRFKPILRRSELVLRQ